MFGISPRKTRSASSGRSGVSSGCEYSSSAENVKIPFSSMSCIAIDSSLKSLTVLSAENTTFTADSLTSVPSV